MKLYDVVLKLLRAQSTLRNSDKELMWAVWVEEGLASAQVINRLNFIEKCPTPESITRCRRKIQELHPELQAVKSVKSVRSAKAKKKGTHIYRETVIKGHWEKRNGTEVWVMDK